MGKRKNARKWKVKEEGEKKKGDEEGREGFKRKWRKQGVTKFGTDLKENGKRENKAEKD